MSNKIKNFFKGINIKRTVYEIFLTLLGTLLLAFGDGVFLVPFNIVSGGVTGLGIIFHQIAFLSVDTWVYIFMWGFFVFGIILLGFKFTLSTLISTIFFPIFLSIILRTNIATGLINMMISDDMSVSLINNTIVISGLHLIEPGRLFIIGFLGGMFVGIGCGITFNGGGSTGGTDILCFILDKYFNIKTSVSGLIIDILIVLFGLVITLGKGIEYRYQFITGLVGVISAMVCAIMIEISYSGRSGVYVADVISSHSSEINEFVIEHLNRTTTIFKVNGGYKNDEHQMIRICLDRREYMKVKDAIAKIDPKAFVMFYKCKSIQGEGFTKLESSKENTVTKIQNQMKNKKGKKINKGNKNAK